METKGSFDTRAGSHYNERKKRCCIMDMNNIWKMAKRCAMEIFMILCGAMLLLNPDAAVALVTRITAWILVILGIFRVRKNLKDSGTYWGDWVLTVLYFLVGGYLMVNPLAISETIGRFLGLVLIIHGISSFSTNRYGSGRVLGILTAVAGVVLVVIPRTLVNTLLGVVGLVLLIVGIINLIDKLRHSRYLEEGGDPNIIDADE